MNSFFSAKETQNKAQREQALFERLPDFIRYAQQECSHYQQLLAPFDAKKITNRNSLAQLPITRKANLIQKQAEHPPLAGINAKKGNINRLFQSPGPINEPENTSTDWWRMGQAFYAAGFRAGDLVQNCLSYHLTPGGFILDSGARACDCIVIPAGPGQTAQQLDIIEQLQPNGYCGTPSFLKILLDKAVKDNRNISSITKALVTGEALAEDLRADFNAAGINVLQAYASADIGLIGFESIAQHGFIIAEDIIVELVRPGTLEPVNTGEVGEIIVTSFNVDYPLIRFATGDLSAELSDQSACGRTNMRIKGWLGRADQTTKIKGMFVHPEQIEKIRQRQPIIEKMRLVVTQKNYNDAMQLYCELPIENYTQAQLTTLEKSIANTLKQITKLSGEVILVALSSLANDGKVIEDQRDNA